MMAEDRRIQIGGSASVSGSQIASGDNVTQTQHLGGEPSPLDQAIARVAELLDRHAAELPEAGRARRDLGDIQDEAAEEDPDRDRMADALGRLGGRVGGIAVLAQAVRELAAQLGLG